MSKSKGNGRDIMALFSHKFFFERLFNPIAIYKIDCDIKELTKNNLIFIDINPAYERVNKVKREEVIGRSFQAVWPTVESCWGDILIQCLKTKKSVHCENESAYTGKYLEVIAFPIATDMAATIFLDRTEWKKSDEKLKENQKQLLEYRARLRELATQLTLSEENTRREIATDLHDSIGHSLLTLLLDLRKLREEHDLSAGATGALDNSIKVAEQMIAESRQLIFELSPPILLEVGITPAVEALADHLLSPRGIGWTVTERGRLEDFSADDAVCVILYRMSRELLVNVIKHSSASKVSISVNRGPKKIQIVVEDNGCGFSVKKRVTKTAGCGLGLFSIRERLIHIGGDMQIISNSAGTTISLLAPLHLNNTEQEGHND